MSNESIAPKQHQVAGVAAETTSTAPSAPVPEKLWHRVRDEVDQLRTYEPGDEALAAASHARHGELAPSWVRTYGRFIIVGGVVCGFAIPEVAHALRPFLPHLLVATLVLALLQADLRQVPGYLRRPGMVTGLLFCLLVLSPLFVAVETKVVLVNYGLPTAIADGMILAALSPPLLAAPAIAFLLGLDSMLALVIAIGAHLLAPVTISMLATTLLGPELNISVAELMSRLGLIIGLGFAIGMTLRQVRLPAKVGRHSQSTIDSLSVIALTLLATAMMDGVTAMAERDPTFVLMAVLCGFLLNPLLQLLGASLFVKSGFKTSLTVGLLAGYRNVGLLIAALTGATDPALLTFLAIVQVSAFVMPLLSTPVLHKVRSIGFDTA